MSKKADNSVPPVKWRYERGVHRHKHCWNKDEAGFVPPEGRGAVGKCPNTLGDTDAERILNDGVPFPEEAGQTLPPKHIYSTHAGVIYEAAPTNSGTYHGYPWRGWIPESVLEELRKKATAQGSEREFNKWVKIYKTSK